MGDPIATVRQRPGSGVLARRGTELLFCPQADEVVLAAFASAPPGQAIDSVTAAVAPSGGTGHTFVVASWAGRARFVVCGEAELTTDHPSLPRLSAASAGTWVERSVTIEDTLVVAAGSGATLPHTALGEGTVASGGFELRIDVISTSTTPPPRTNEPSPSQTAVATAAPQTPAPVPAPPAARTTGFAALGDDESGSDQELETDEDLGLAELDQWASTPRQPDEPTPSGQLVACEVCMAPVDATASSCPTCGTPGRPGPARPSEWSLEFDDGRVEPIDPLLRLGRDPSPAGRARPVKVDSELASADHVEIRRGGDDVQLIDLSSRNGTFVLTTGDAQFVPIEPGQPHRVGDGAVVQVGRVRFTVRRGRGDVTGE